MDKKTIGIETLKIIIITLVCVILLLIYSKLNTIQDSFQSFDAYSTSSEVSVQRDAMLSNAVTIAAMSQQYFRKPLTFGGGANSFHGFTIPGSVQKSIKGSFEVVIVRDDSMTIIGIGNAIGADGKNPIQLELGVNPKNIGKTSIIN
jgi:hypothetical protein